MRKSLLFASGAFIFATGYYVGRRKFKKLFDTVCDISKDDKDEYQELVKENIKLEFENTKLELKIDNLEDSIAELKDENALLLAGSDVVSQSLHEWMYGEMTDTEFLHNIRDHYEVSCANE